MGAIDISGRVLAVCVLSLSLWRQALKFCRVQMIRNLSMNELTDDESEYVSIDMESDEYDTCNFCNETIIGDSVVIPTRTRKGFSLCCAECV